MVTISSVMVTPKTVPMLILLSTFAGNVPENLGQLLRETPIKLIVTVLQTLQEKLDVFMMPILSQPGLMRHNIFHAFNNGIDDQNCRKTLPSYFCAWSRISVMTAIVINVVNLNLPAIWYHAMPIILTFVHKILPCLRFNNCSIGSIVPVSCVASLVSKWYTYCRTTFRQHPSISNWEMPSPF